MVDIHNSLKRFEVAWRRVASLDDAEPPLAFLGHLEALGLSKLRIVKYASALCTILKNVEFDPAGLQNATWKGLWHGLTGNPLRNGLNIPSSLPSLRKLIQFAKNGSCDRRTPVPTRLHGFRSPCLKRTAASKPETLTPDKVKAMIRAAENGRDKALTSILYEAALRPAGCWT